MKTASSIHATLHAPINAAVIAPTFNNERTLAGILSRLARLELPIIVVNDGSTDSTAEILRKELSACDAGNFVVCTHQSNGGKGAALQSGFAEAIARGYTHAVTIDTDAQLAPEDIPALLSSAARSPGALIVGTRDADADDYPSRSRLGRQISNWLVRLESGLRVEDSQCGLRVYPLSVVQRTRCRAGYFGYETEILTRAAWAGVDVIGVRVSCRYFAPDQRVSHFKPWRDSLRATRMHARLLLIAAGVKARRLLTSRPRANDPTPPVASPVAIAQSLEASR